MAEEVKKIYTAEEVKRIAPGYRGKLENFDPAKRGQKRTAPKVGVFEINPRETFSANYSKLIEVSNECFSIMLVDEQHIYRLLAKEELAYYATAMLHLKFIEVKAKQGQKVLTTQEKSLRNATSDFEFNVPFPIANYLTSIGSIHDEMGKETLLAVPDLPVAAVQGRGGYHAAEISQENHVLFEEVPCFGVLGDVVMALTQAADTPQIDVKIRKPANSAFTENLCGYSSAIGPRRPEIKSRLAGQGITPTTFPEYATRTRFHLKYIQSISDIIGKMETFNNEKFVLKNTSQFGTAAQVIKTIPIGDSNGARAVNRDVEARSASIDSTAVMGAGMCYGFQLYKEDGEGATITEKTANWSCLTGEGATPWAMPEAWNANRNERRNLPPVLNTERFRGVSNRQDDVLTKVIRRMVKTKC